MSVSFPGHHTFQSERVGQTRYHMPEVRAVLDPANRYVKFDAAPGYRTAAAAKRAALDAVGVPFVECEGRRRGPADFVACATLRSDQAYLADRLAERGVVPIVQK